VYVHEFIKSDARLNKPKTTCGLRGQFQVQAQLLLNPAGGGGENKYVGFRLLWAAGLQNYLNLLYFELVTAMLGTKRDNEDL